VWFIRFFHTTKDLGDPGSSRGTLERVRVDLTVLSNIPRESSKRACSHFLSRLEKVVAAIGDFIR
jgi:hypothetical protein